MAKAIRPLVVGTVIMSVLGGGHAIGALALAPTPPRQPENLPVAGDFDGDGEADLAVGVPNEDVGAVAGAGSVNVIYGSGGGLVSDGNQVWNQASSGIAGRAEQGDGLGSSVAVGDFDGDGFSDLAVGVPGEDASAGAVNVLYGTIAAGLDATGNQLWTQDSPGISGTSEPGDLFGSSVAVGDFDEDGFADLAVGAPGEDGAAGTINVLYGSADGLTAASNQLWNQEQPGILGTKSPNDRFGFSLAAGDFDANGESDLAVGVPYDDELGPKNAGLVNVLYGSSGTGLSSAENQLWSQDSPDVADASEQGDDVGFALASADLGDDGFADLAAAAPKEDLGGTMDAGGVNVLYGAAGGLSSVGNQFWAQGQGGLLGTAGEGDQFGRSLAAAEFGNAVDVTAGDLAVGAPFDDEPGTTDAGAVSLLYGDATGLSATGNELWSQGSPGIPSDAEAGDQFGISLARGEFGNGPREDLAVGVAYEDVNGVGRDEGAVNLIYGYVHGGLQSGGAQFWNQDSAGIGDQCEPGDLFGSAVA